MIDKVMYVTLLMTEACFKGERLACSGLSKNVNVGLFTDSSNVTIQIFYIGL